MTIRPVRNGSLSKLNDWSNLADFTHILDRVQLDIFSRYYYFRINTVSGNEVSLNRVLKMFLLPLITPIVGQVVKLLHARKLFYSFF